MRSFARLASAAVLTLAATSCAYSPPASAPPYAAYGGYPPAPYGAYAAAPGYGPRGYAEPAMPQYCSVNNTAAGAVGGALLGAALGGIAGGGRGALIGAGSGALLGGVTGAQADAQCQQLAIQRAYARAEAQAAAAQAALAAQQAALRPGPLPLPPSAYEPVYEDYQTPSNSHRHRVTIRRLNSYADPASRQVCDTYTRIDADVDGNTSNTTTARRCKGADGQWHDV